MRTWVGRHREAEGLRRLLRHRQLRRNGKTLRRVTKAIRADQVVSSYSDAVSLFLRHSAAARSASTGGGDSLPNAPTYKQGTPTTTSTDR